MKAAAQPPVITNKYELRQIEMAEKNIKRDMKDPLSAFEEVFESQPKIKYEEPLDTINKLGPIQIREWIEKDLIRFNPELKTVVAMEINIKYLPQTGEYTGQVNEEGQMHGVGRYYWNFGQRFYEGSFYQGKFHGFGRFIDAYNNCYIGQFQNNLRSGYGKQIDYLGHAKEGLWHRNLFQPKGLPNKSEMTDEQIKKEEKLALKAQQGWSDPMS